MIGLLQRVSEARVDIASLPVASINTGLVVLVGIERDDTEVVARRLLERLLGYRVFADKHGKMNHSLVDIGGGLLLVPQFTLAADTQSGMRPSFMPAASPDQGRQLFDYLVRQARTAHKLVASGVFGADMQVKLTNDGPVTFWLQVAGSTTA